MPHVVRPLRSPNVLIGGGNYGVVNTHPSTQPHQIIEQPPHTIVHKEPQYKEPQYQDVSFPHIPPPQHHFTGKIN